MTIRFEHPPLAEYRRRLRASAPQGDGPERAARVDGLPLVSIVTAVRNGERHLARSIESVLDQTYSNIEYIVTDGASTDRTLDIIRSYGPRVACWVSEPDTGPFDGMNRGIALANGELVKIHGADDVMPSDSVATAVEAFRANGDPNVIVRGNMAIIDARGEVTQIVEPRPQFRYMPPILHPTWYVPMSVYERFGLYDPTSRVSSDYEMYFHLKSHGIRFLDVHRVLAEFRTGGASSTLDGFYDTFRTNHRYAGLWVASYLALVGGGRRALRRALAAAVGEERVATAWHRFRRRGST
jgi:glycosyltransferase involved in cell wall biosynthesis